MRPLPLLLFSIGLMGCLDFAPGTPTPLEDGGMPVTPTTMPDLATKPSQQPAVVDMAKPATTPGVDMAMGPPAPLGMLICETSFSLAGTYVQGTAPPTDFPGGCWPDGTWTFSATITQNGCANAPTLPAQFQFKVVQDLDFNNTITYLTDPNNMYLTTKVSGGEGGICSGIFKIYSADGKAITNLHPVMQADNSLNGSGDIRFYDIDQRF